MSCVYRASAHEQISEDDDCGSRDMSGVQASKHDALPVHMSPAEVAMLTSVLQSAKNYLEFGCGGSTVLACRTVRDSIISVDSSKRWLAFVEEEMLRSGSRLMPKLFHVDIGDVGDWGVPRNMDRKSDWPAYYEEVWTSEPSAIASDTILIDGRFRVATFLTAILHCRADALLMIHDYSNRPEYFAIRECASELATVETLSLFRPRNNFDTDRCRSIIEEHRFNHD